MSKNDVHLSSWIVSQHKSFSQILFLKNPTLKETHDIITAGLTLPFPQVVSSCLSSTLSTTQRRWNSWNRVSSNCRGLDQRSWTPPFVKQQSSLIQGTGTLPIFLSYNMFFDILYINLRIVHCTVLLKYHSSCKHLILSSTKKNMLCHGRVCKSFNLGFGVVEVAGIYST